ncbi:MAG: hypothetical protein JXP34_13040 [Planctomycetes bacterium]|nr:hypothetical protein [Planctomycetota bacterium]
MRAKTAATVALLVFVAASIAYLVVREAGGAAGPASDPAAGGGHEVIAFYFHGNMRCTTCLTIEGYAKEAIEAGFREALDDGRLTWRVVNIDEPANEHFVDDFQLATRSVVLVDVRDGKRTAWKNLERIWELVGDKEAFISYIQDETRAYLEGRGG